MNYSYKDFKKTEPPMILQVLGAILALFAVYVFLIGVMSL
jgi:hypothetical protein